MAQNFALDGFYIRSIKEWFLFAEFKDYGPQGPDIYRLIVVRLSYKLWGLVVGTAHIDGLSLRQSEA